MSSTIFLEGGFQEQDALKDELVNIEIEEGKP
jgi:hypothetical protein